MRKILLGLAAAAAIATPLAAATAAEAKTTSVQSAVAPASDAKATGNVGWTVTTVDGTFTGTVDFVANNKTGGTLSMVNSFGYWLNGTVTPGTVKQIGNVVTFDGTFAEGSANYLAGGNVFHGVVRDNGKSDQIAVFVNEAPYEVWADVTSGNLTVH